MYKMELISYSTWWGSTLSDSHIKNQNKDYTVSPWTNWNTLCIRMNKSWDTRIIGEMNTQEGKKIQCNEIQTVMKSKIIGEGPVGYCNQPHILCGKEIGFFPNVPRRSTKNNENNYLRGRFDFNIKKNFSTIITIVKSNKLS